MLSQIDTFHGLLELPVFLPDATRAVVKTLDSTDLAQVGIRALVVNVFHLLKSPGIRILGGHGGIHGFMGWNGVVVSDSGGFQIYSLTRSDPGSGSITEKGFVWHDRKSDKRVNLSAEKSIQRQFQLGADIMVTLDHCTHPDDPEDEQVKSVRNTIQWAKRGRAEFDRLIDEKKLERASRPLLFAVIQGGNDRGLREECAGSLIEIGFDGYAFGGWPLDKGGELVEAVELTAKLMPRGQAKFALGICGPEHIVKCVEMGYEIFDGALPTRDARRGRLYKHPVDLSEGIKSTDFYDRIYISDEKFAADGRPVDETCDCPACSRYGRAYIHHLFKIEDPLGWRLATIHNLRFYTRLMGSLGKR
jgi:queuine tRNA-ribosyltransferase